MLAAAAYDFSVKRRGKGSRLFTPPKMNRSLLRIATVLCTLGISAFFFSGCASVADLPATNASLQPVHKITLLAVREPKRVGLDNLGGAAGAFGLLGAAVQIANNADNSKAFKAGIDQHHIVLNQPLMETLENGLKRGGYEVAVDTIQYPTAGPNGTDDFSAVKVDSDAILAVWFVSTGYFSSPRSLHYSPHVIMKALLIDAKSKVVLYDRTYNLGFEMKIRNIQNLEANPKYSYLSSTRVLDHIDEAATGLIESENQIAERINRDLAKKELVTAK